MEQTVPSLEQIPPLTLENLRPRLYKAVRATLLAHRDPEARAAHLSQWLTALAAEGPREVTFPEALAESQRQALQEGWRRALNRCRILAEECFHWEGADFDRV
ncbi:MAG: hypothetical protein JRI59_10400, partial [Deltaproteobacteria bacterium]|nr:hypothetical protein [Deltaproteobacteria bacterium]